MDPKKKNPTHNGPFTQHTTRLEAWRREEEACTGGAWGGHMHSLCCGHKAGIFPTWSSSHTDLAHPAHIPISRPRHLPFLLGALCLQTSVGSAPSLHSSICSNAPPWRALPWPPYFRKTLSSLSTPSLVFLHDIYYHPIFCFIYLCLH